MFKKLMIVFLVLESTACATVHETYAPDGRKSFALNCSGTARGWDKCYVAAGEKCGSAGYDIIDSNSEDVLSGSVVANRDGAVANSTKSNERTMLISCKTQK